MNDLLFSNCALIAALYTIDVTFTPTGRGSQMTEMVLYTVKDGQVVREQFFYKFAGSRNFGCLDGHWLT